jgi:uncharacterized protein (TIGR00251 family)
MKIDIRVTPKAKKNLVKKEGSILKVYVTAPAADNKANEAVINVLAEHFGVKPRQIEMIKGLKSRIKTISISPIH